MRLIFFCFQNVTPLPLGHLLAALSFKSLWGSSFQAKIFEYVVILERWTDHLNENYD